MENIGLSPEMFERYKPAVTEDEGNADRGRGYLGDAMYGLFRHVSAWIAAAIIVAVALFSLLVPLFVGRSDSLMDPYYAKLPPRVAMANGAGLFDGGVSRRLGSKGLIGLAAIAIGASSDGGATLRDVIDGEYSPIIEIGDAEGRVYPVRVDSYLEVGFVYKAVDEEEYQSMLAWERESGRQILYPLIADNEFCPDRLDANAWYKADRDGTALREVEGGYDRVDFTLDMSLLDNYARDSFGDVIYALPSGESALRVRVLYYNYYLYKNGTAPNYILGTDSQGYDLALRVAGGIRVSLLIAVVVSLINLMIGAFVGAIEGYYGGVVDLALERVTDILSGVPFIVVATLFQIYLSDKAGAVPSLLFAFVLTGWLGTANRVRAQFYRFKNSEYVLAARSMGVSDARIMVRHILPNTLGTLITASALAIPGVIFTESMLSFLGIVNLGAEGITSLGTLMSDASDIWVNYPHLMIAPALVISLLMISFNLLGNGLRDAFNPNKAGGV